MKFHALMLVCGLLAGCDASAPTSLAGDSDGGSALDQQAIAKGILPDPDKLEFAGRFETRSDLGIDKFCAVSNGARQFSIGLLAVFGPESKCEAKGTARINGDKVQVTLLGKRACQFDAHYDGVELRFPGSIESGCASYCTDRASLSGTHYFIVQSGDEQARRTLGRDIERLCT
ncbi:MAG: hypothetical protein WBO17_07790 [Sphingorhabdus sp.]